MFVGVNVMKTELKQAADDLLYTLPEEDKLELLAKSRFSCESRWMTAMAMTAGWEVANRLNLEVGASVAEGEMRRLMKLAGWSGAKEDSDVLLMVWTAMELLTPKKYFDYSLEFVAPGRMLGVLTQCLACTKVKSLGVERDYECGCFGLRAGWYRAMGIKARETLQKCMLEGDERCEILVEVDEYAS
jgi:hypothetical protein